MQNNAKTTLQSKTYISIQDTAEIGVLQFNLVQNSMTQKYRYQDYLGTG